MRFLSRLDPVKHPVISIIIASILTFLWFLLLYTAGMLIISTLPLRYELRILIFYILAGITSLYITCKPIGFKRTNFVFCILSFFSAAFIPIIRYGFKINARRPVIYLLFIFGILLWHYEMAFITRAAIGGVECNKGVPSDLKSIGLYISMYQCDHDDFYPDSFSQLYQDKNTVKDCELTLSEVEEEYRYLPPEKYPVSAETIIAYTRKPRWHFHSLNEGGFQASVLYAYGNFRIIPVSKNRYNGSLRRIFFWYFLTTPFEGPAELTPEEI